MLSIAHKHSPDVAVACTGKNGLPYWSENLIETFFERNYFAKDSKEECMKTAQEFVFTLNAIEYKHKDKKWVVKLTLNETAQNIANTYVGAFFWSPIEIERQIHAHRMAIQRIEKKGTLFKDQDQKEIDEMKGEIKTLKKMIDEKMEDTPPILFECKIEKIEYATGTKLEINMAATTSIELANRSLLTGDNFTMFLIERTYSNKPK